MDSYIDWFKTENQYQLNGVALVIHGLNLQPDKMESIINQLTKAGIEAVNLSLRGHGDNYSHHSKSNIVKARMASFKTAYLQLWLEETQRAYLAVKKRGKEKAVPIFLIGFSFGSLIGLDLFTSDSEIWFDKMILFAPAISIRGINYGIQLLKPFPRLVIPSRSIKSYRANKGTPVSGYNALFETLKHFRNNLSQKLNIPTVVFIDKRDEFISYRGIQKMAEKNRLDQWKLHWVQKDKTKAPIKNFHLIIDEPSVGKYIWDKMMNRMVKHLLI